MEAIGLAALIAEETQKGWGDRFREATDFEGVSQSPLRALALAGGGVWGYQRGGVIGAVAAAVVLNLVWNSILEDLPSKAAIDRLADDLDPSQSGYLPGNQLAPMLREQRQAGNPVWVARAGDGDKTRALTAAQYQDHLQRDWAGATTDTFSAN